MPYPKSESVFSGLCYKVWGGVEKIKNKVENQVWKVVELKIFLQSLLFPSKESNLKLDFIFIVRVL